MWLPKDYSTQQCLLALLEKWNRAVDTGQMFGALLKDLSKAFDCLDHELLIAELNAYGFSLPALKLVHDLFFILNDVDIASYSDDNTPDVIAETPMV